VWTCTSPSALGVSVTSPTSASSTKRSAAGVIVLVRSMVPSTV
jgi:hypothetical protein